MADSFLKIVAMAAARNCFDSGMSVATIAKQSGKSPAVIRRWLKTTGLKTTRPARPA